MLRLIGLRNVVDDNVIDSTLTQFNQTLDPAVLISISISVSISIQLCAVLKADIDFRFTLAFELVK